MSTATKEPRMTPPRLYLIFDDWKSGYSFRKIDLSSDDPESPVTGGVPREAATTLPPPFFRMRARRGMPMHFSAIGSRILAMPPKEEGGTFDNGGACLDVPSRSLVFVPRPTDQNKPIYFCIGHKFFTLGSSSFQYLDTQHLDGPLDGPTRQDWLWCDLPKLPAKFMSVFSHTVLPDEQTIFVSIGFITPDATYSFHMADDGRSAWKCLGNWMLPFQGRGYFDRKLNTWIGLSIYGKNRGHICCCQLESSITDDCLDVKYSKEYLFSKESNEEHVGATLVSMGQESKYCLVESVAIGYYKRQGAYTFERESSYFRYMFRLTMFSLEYDEDGELRTGHSRVRYYFAPKHQVTRFACQSPAAFFM